MCFSKKNLGSVHSSGKTTYTFKDATPGHSQKTTIIKSQMLIFRVP